MEKLFLISLLVTGMILGAASQQDNEDADNWANYFWNETHIIGGVTMTTCEDVTSADMTLDSDGDEVWFDVEYEEPTICSGEKYWNITRAFNKDRFKELRSNEINFRRIDQDANWVTLTLDVDKDKLNNGTSPNVSCDGEFKPGDEGSCTEEKVTDNRILNGHIIDYAWSFKPERALNPTNVEKGRFEFSVSESYSGEVNVSYAYKHDYRNLYSNNDWGGFVVEEEEEADQERWFNHSLGTVGSSNVSANVTMEIAESNTLRNSTEVNQTDEWIEINVSEKEGPTSTGEEISLENASKEINLGPEKMSDYEVNLTSKFLNSQVNSTSKQLTVEDPGDNPGDNPGDDPVERMVQFEEGGWKILNIAESIDGENFSDCGENRAAYYANPNLQLERLRSGASVEPGNYFFYTSSSCEVEIKTGSIETTGMTDLNLFKVIDLNGQVSSDVFNGCGEGVSGYYNRGGDLGLNRFNADSITPRKYFVYSPNQCTVDLPT